MNLTMERAAFLPLTMEDYEGRNQRAMFFLRTMPPERKIGFWYSPTQQGLPNPVANKARLLDDHLFKVLKEIERHAGYISYRHGAFCRLCRDEGGTTSIRKNWNGHREFIFQPLLTGFLYRWPEGLMHYHDDHKIAAPEWLPELVNDFNKARDKGLWLG